MIKRTGERIETPLHRITLILTMHLKSSILLLFIALNVALYLLTLPVHAIPIQHVIASIVAFVLVVITANSRIHRQVTLEKSKSFKKYFPIFTLSELITFLVIPWVSILLAFHGKDNWEEVSCIFSPHLYIIQTQIGLESILISDKRHGALFRFILISNVYRGFGIASSVIEYITCKDIFSPSQTPFLNMYMASSILVYILSNLVIVKLWYPLLRFGDDLTAGGLRTYKDSVCIITGGASGIGREMALELGKRGAKAVIVIDMQVKLAETVAASLKSMSVESMIYEVDVRDLTSMKRVVNETKKHYGRLDYMINNAGILVIGPIEKIGAVNFDYIFDVNVRGTHHGVQAAYPIMKGQGFGHIVNVSSLLGIIPGGDWAVAYSASKHAVVGLSTNLRLEAAKYGVRVSCFCPGTVDTPIHSGGAYGKNLTGIPAEIWNTQIAKMKAMDARVCAAIALDEIANNKALFVVPRLPMLVSRIFYRMSPCLWLHSKANMRQDWRKDISKRDAGEVAREKEQ